MNQAVAAAPVGNPNNLELNVVDFMTAFVGALHD
jgi:hypothetical protein